MIYPPRPKNKIAAGSLSEYDNNEYYAQVKLNGSCFVSKYGKNYNRYGEHRPNWKINLPSNAIFVGEYMNKGKYQHFDVVIWDILRVEVPLLGIRNLVGKTIDEREDVLTTIFRHNISPHDTHKYLHDLGGGIGIIRNIESGFADLYEEVIKDNMLEGLVLKSREAKLNYWSSDSANSAWQIKVRKPNKLYSN